MGTKLTVRLEFEGETRLFRTELGNGLAQSWSISTSVSLISVARKKTYCPLVASGPNTLPTCSTFPSTTTLLSAGFMRRSKTE